MQSDLSTKVTTLSTNKQEKSDELDKIEQLRNEQRSLVDATRSQKWDQISELSQVFQSIHNLDYICSQRPEGTPSSGGLNYQATQFVPELPKNITNID